VKCITTLHGTDITVVGTHPTMKNITRYAINSSDAVTSVSNFLKQKTESTLDIGQKKIQTIYNFINPLNFNPNLKRNQLCKTSKGRCAIVHVSNLRQVKSPLNMLKIFKGIHEAGVKEVELKIVGEGPMEIKMREWCADNRIEDLVQFMGVRSNIGNILASSYLMLLPSKFESFGLVALEAMACGVPVVASNTGGIPEVIDDGVNGILFESENIEQAICKAVDLISNPERLQAMRKACVEQVNTKFEFNKIIKQYEHLYRSLVV
ncbi:MAG: N-acetyl-alpha-D-glucosaminyl L-malate synthase BshA, partial [Alphaproteobacteria bacterium]|nr:N-acetyl-alpha-D-glucosaminyl L-malate synthase BshA [Alphaproteobacteria bacterium]